MADRIVTADEANRAPNWRKWRLIPDLAPWQCVALSLNIDCDEVRIQRSEEWWETDTFNESREFDDRLYIVCENLHKTLQCTEAGVLKSSPRVNVRQFAEWVRQIGWNAPPELLAMADDQVVINSKSAHSGNRTATATTKREAKKRDRVADLKQYVDDVYEAANQGAFDLGSGNDRKALPFSTDDLHTLFIVRHREHRVKLATFAEDLGTIGAKVKPGTKRCGIKELSEMLAGKLSG